MRAEQTDDWQMDSREVAVAGMKANEDGYPMSDDRRFSYLVLFRLCCTDGATVSPQFSFLGLRKNEGLSYQNSIIGASLESWAKEDEVSVPWWRGSRASSSSCRVVLLIVVVVDVVFRRLGRRRRGKRRSNDRSRLVI
jgi:hypothetical protein